MMVLTECTISYFFVIPFFITSTLRYSNTPLLQEIMDGVLLDLNRLKPFRWAVRSINVMTNNSESRNIEAVAFS